MLYRSRPVEVDAIEWHKNGDYPGDDVQEIPVPGENPRSTDGKIVARYRSSHVPANAPCGVCGVVMQLHGEVDKQVVCPGDYVVKVPDQDGFVVMHPDEFAERFERVTGPLVVETGGAGDTPPVVPDPRELITVARAACEEMLAAVADAGGDNAEYHAQAMIDRREKLYPVADAAAQRDGAADD